MLNESSFWRQLDILNPRDTTKEIGIIGAGGIGSPTALLLAKIGFNNLFIWDNDKIEAHNIPNQLYRTKDLTRYKTEALAEIIKDFTDIEPTIKTEKWDGTIKPVTILAVDSMDTRIEIYNQIKDKEEAELLIDARMGGEFLRIYAIQPQSPLDCEFYEKNLYPSSEAVALPCTAQTIFYNVFTLAGLIGAIVKHFILNEEYPREIIFDLKSLSFIKN